MSRMNLNQSRDLWSRSLKLTMNGDKNRMTKHFLRDRVHRTRF